MKFLIMLSFACSSFMLNAADNLSKYAVMEAEKYNYTAYDADDTAWYGGGINLSDSNRYFPDFVFIDPVTEKKITSADLFKGNRAVVIEYGNVTCPSFLSKENKMTQLYRKYKKDVNFYVMYIRENHPGRNFPEHRSMKTKIDHAKKMIEFDKIEIPIIVDDLKGTAHQALGNYPNSSVVIGKDRMIAYRGKMNVPEQVEDSIKDLLAHDKMGAKVSLVDKANSMKKGERSPELQFWYEVILARTIENKTQKSLSSQPK